MVKSSIFKLCATKYKVYNIYIYIYTHTHTHTHTVYIHNLGYIEVLSENVTYKFILFIIILNDMCTLCKFYIMWLFHYVLKDHFWTCGWTLGRSKQFFYKQNIVVKRERENQQDVTIRFYYQHCLNMFRASLCPSSGEQRQCVTACGVLRWFCWMWLVAVVGLCVVGCEHCKGLLFGASSVKVTVWCEHCEGYCSTLEQ